MSAPQIEGLGANLSGSGQTPPGRSRPEQKARRFRPHTVHPLLVYAELLAKPGERSAEAAQELLEHYLPAFAT